MNDTIDNDDQFDELSELEELKLFHSRRVCLNCSYFFQSCNDEPNFGICIDDETFEPFLDEMFENGKIECCEDLYSSKRYDGDRDACDKFEPCTYTYPEDDADEEDDEIDEADLRERIVQQYLDLDIGAYIAALPDCDNEKAKNILLNIMTAVSFGHKNALDLLIKYYSGLGPVTDLEDARRRIIIIDMLDRSIEEDTRVVDAFINELYRSQTTYFTRALFLRILYHFEYCDRKLLVEPIKKLLSKKQFSNIMTKRLQDIMHGRVKKKDRFIF